MTEHDIEKALSEDVPAEMITQRSGGGGIKLDYVTGRFIKQRLNEIFGWSGWSMEVIDKQLFPDDCTCFAHVRLTVMLREEGIEVTKDGMAYGHGRKGGEGFDFAIAEAVTDALKRAAVLLGQQMGLSLYPIAKGSKADPHAKDPAVEAFSDHISKAMNLTELEEIGRDIAKAGLTEQKEGVLRALYQLAHKRLST